MWGEKWKCLYGQTRCLAASCCPYRDRLGRRHQGGVSVGRCRSNLELPNPSRDASKIRPSRTGIRTEAWTRGSAFIVELESNPPMTAPIGPPRIAPTIPIKTQMTDLKPIIWGRSTSSAGTHWGSHGQFATDIADATTEQESKEETRSNPVGKRPATHRSLLVVAANPSRFECDLNILSKSCASRWICCSAIF
jgi:hypothetical protein